MSFYSSFSDGKTGRHETFFPRFGWLKKGYDQCKRNNHVFNDNNSIEKLGVGKNMVRSIRFWCTLFGIIEPIDKSGCFSPTKFGEQLFDENNGWDPYLEDSTSLWLLHWKIFKPPFLALSWNLSFSYVTLATFSMDDLSEAIYAKYKDFSPNKSIARSSFKRDAACLINMYKRRRTNESEIISPFSELKLIDYPYALDRKSNSYRFSQEQKLNLPDLLFLYAVLDYASTWYPDQKSIALSQIAYGPNSPGLVFRLSESECGSRLERACRETEDVFFTETNGIRQVQFQNKPSIFFESYLHKYYGGQK
jgi:hypothetical protein